MAEPIYNPWREFIENVIDGTNYFRSSEYHALLDELDDLYSDRAALLEALRIAVRQNGNDMLLTGEELRQCEAAIAKATGEAQ